MSMIRIITNAIFIAVLSFCFTQTAFSGEASFPDVLMTPSGLDKINFRDKAFFEALTEGWQPSANPDAYNTYKEIRTIEGVSFFNDSFDASWRETAKGDNDFILHNMGDRGDEYRIAILEKAKKIWGNPAHEVDRSFGSEDLYLYNYRVQWLLSNSVIEFVFFGVRREERQVNASFSFGSTESNPPMRELDYFRCSVTARGIGFGKDEEAPQRAKDVFMTVDYDKRAILDKNRSPLWKITEMSSDSIIAKRDNKEADMVLMLDPTSGKYTTEVTIKNNPNQKIITSGVCSKNLSTSQENSAEANSKKSIPRFLLEYAIVSHTLKHDRGCDMELLESSQMENISKYWWGAIAEKCNGSWKKLIKETGAMADLSTVESKKKWEEDVERKTSVCAQTVILDNWDKINKTIVEDPQKQCKGMRESAGSSQQSHPVKRGELAPLPNVFQH